MENWSDFDFVCMEIFKASERGDPIKDVLEKSAYTETEFIVELIRSHLGMNDEKFDWGALQTLRKQSP